MRLDKWLWYVRLARSRRVAQQLCEGRHLRLDGRVIERSAAPVRAGAILSFPRGGQVVAVRVEGLPQRRGPAAEARGCYTPLLPAPEARSGARSEARSDGRLAGHPGFAVTNGPAVARNAIDEAIAEAVAQPAETSKLGVA